MDKYYYIQDLNTGLYLRPLGSDELFTYNLSKAGSWSHHGAMDCIYGLRDDIRKGRRWHLVEYYLEF